MKKSEVKIGKAYWANVEGQRVAVRIESEKEKGGWIASSLETGEEVTIANGGRLQGVCSAKDQAKFTQAAEPKRRSRKKSTKKAAKERRREAIIEAAVALLSTDPKKAKSVGEIYAAMVEAGTHEAAGQPGHGAIYYALKFEIENNPKTRVVCDESAYYLRKKR